MSGADAVRLAGIQILGAWLMMLALVVPAAGQAPARLSEDPASRLVTVPHDPALERALRDAGLARVAVRHEGWNETTATWARLKVYELTGRTKLHGQDPLFTALSLVYQTERWVGARILPIEHPRVGELLQTDEKWISLRDLLESPHQEAMRAELEAGVARREEFTRLQKLLDAVHQIRSIGPERTGLIASAAEAQELDPTEIARLLDDAPARTAEHRRLRALSRQVKREKPILEAGIRLLDRAILLTGLDERLLLVPNPESATNDWLSVREVRRLDALHGGARDGAARVLPSAAAQLDAALRQTFATGNAEGLAGEVDRFLETVGQSRQYPSAGYLARKNFYTAWQPSRTAAWAYALATILFGLFAFFHTPGWRLAGTAIMVVGLAWQTLGLGMRLSLTGHMPVSNMYESIVFTSWAALAIGAGIELRKRTGIVGLFASAVGFVALLGVSLMPLHESRIHPLRAVLNSYWLNIHVTAMLISYAAFAISAVFAAGYLVKSWARREALFGGKPLMATEQMEEFAYRLVQIGWPILTLGVLLGAVWADTAWGRFWGWDPKETWALITWITYTIYLHTRMVMGWKGRVSALACLIGFLMVLITWIGVSYIPAFAGGLHTYASPT
jgi:cytochrome c-type biogenesis protein CcsB